MKNSLQTLRWKKIHPPRAEMWGSVTSSGQKSGSGGRMGAAFPAPPPISSPSFSLPSGRKPRPRSEDINTLPRDQSSLSPPQVDLKRPLPSPGRRLPLGSLSSGRSLQDPAHPFPEATSPKSFESLFWLCGHAHYPTLDLPLTPHRCQNFFSTAHSTLSAQENSMPVG